MAHHGGRERLNRLVSEHIPEAMRFAIRLTGRAAWAEEVVQEALYRAIRSADTFRGGSQFRTWLFRIASNAAMDTLRRRKVIDFVALEEDYEAPAEAPGPEVQFETKQRLRALDAALARLTVEQREMILLREVEGLSYEEISTVLGIQEGTVKSRLARAREALAAFHASTEAGTT